MIPLHPGAVIALSLVAVAYTALLSLAVAGLVRSVRILDDPPRLR